MFNVLTENQVNVTDRIFWLLFAFLVAGATLFLMSLLRGSISVFKNSNSGISRFIEFFISLFCVFLIFISISRPFSFAIKKLSEHNTFVLYHDNVKVQNIDLKISESKSTEKNKIDIINHFNSLNDEEKEDLTKLINDGNEYEIIIKYEEEIKNTQNGSSKKIKTIHEIKQK